MASIQFNVEGMTCGGCEKSVRNALMDKDGVSEVVASHTAGTVKVDFDDSKIQQAALKQAIEDAGFDVAA